LFWSFNRHPNEFYLIIIPFYLIIILDT